jgi:hypothetical protein
MQRVDEEKFQQVENKNNKSLRFSSSSSSLVATMR